MTTPPPLPLCTGRHLCCRAQTDVAFGLAGSAGVVTAQDATTPSYGLLASPTPGQPNSGPLPSVGPLVSGTLRSTASRPDGSSDIPVTTYVAVQQNPVASVQLIYVVGYNGSETTVPMTAGGNATASAASSGSLSDNLSGATLYIFSIPSSDAQVGALVRWAVVATDSTGTTTRDPPGGKNSTDARYYGTVVGDPSDQASLPIMELYCPDPQAPMSGSGVSGCSLWLDGDFWDNLKVGQRGATSRSWPKPKVKIDSKDKVGAAPPVEAGQLGLGCSVVGPGGWALCSELLACSEALWVGWDGSQCLPGEGTEQQQGGLVSTSVRARTSALPAL